MPIKDGLRPIVAFFGFAILFGLLAVFSQQHSPFVADAPNLLFIIIGILCTLAALFIIGVLVYYCVRRGT